MMKTRKRLSKYRDNSVINLDSFDKRRFEKIAGMSKNLQQIQEESEFHSMQPLMNDMWGSLYKANPQLKDSDEISEELSANHSIMSDLMSDESFEEYRNFTKLDELASAIGTVKYSEKANEWIEKMRLENERIEELMKEIEQMQKEQNKNPQNQELQDDLNKAMQGLGQEFQSALNGNGSQLKSDLGKAMEQANQIKQNVKDLLGGVNQGTADAELKKVPLKHQITLAELLMNNSKLQKIAEWAGRMKSIARKKQKSKHAESINRDGITLGNHIEDLLPAELALYSHPATKLDFMRRFVEGETLQFEKKGKEELGKGPIVFCLDQSGSMHDKDLPSKGFTLALMSIAKRQKRDFALVLFSRDTRTKIYPKGNISVEDMVDLATTFLDGGTDFVKPLSEAKDIINQSRFNQADIVFLTDGEASVSESFLNGFLKVKEEKDFKVLSLAMGSGAKTNTLEKFSDKVVRITDFSDEKSYAAFEI